MPVPADARALAQLHRTRQQQIAARATAETGRLWGFLQSLSWAGISNRTLHTVQTAMAEAARGAQDYVAAAVRRWGREPDPAGQVAEQTFAATASDGRPLASLLEQPHLEVAAFVGRGMPTEQADLIGRRHLQRIVATQVADAARVATGVAVVNDRSVEGYVRLLTLPSCNRCIILAGQFYRWSDGFERHPQCFPAGVVVSGPSVSAATRRWFQGELVHLATASGEKLSLTGNHPVLTRRGWVPANLLQEGDEVVRSTHAEGATPLVVPDHQYVPSLIEDVWRSLGMAGLRRMPTTPQDFHGDGQYGEVDVVYADSALRDERDALPFEQPGEFALAVRGEFGLAFDQQRVPVLVDGPHASHTGSRIGGGGLAFPFLLSHLPSPDLASRTWSTPRHACVGQPLADDIAAHAVLAAKRVFAAAAQVGGGDGLDRQFLVGPRWDAPAAAFSMESRAAYASRGSDLLHRLAGQVELDRLLEVRRVGWSGHVYSLTSAEGWHSANNLIVSNCDCIHVPAAEATNVPSPREVYDSLSDDERRKAGWSGFDQRAIDDGADLFQVTNYKKALKTVTVAGRPVKTTTVGTTRRGLAGKRGAKLRLTPEAIYLEADRLGWDRDATIRELKRHGYIA